MDKQHNKILEKPNYGYIHPNLPYFVSFDSNGTSFYTSHLKSLIWFKYDHLSPQNEPL